MSVASSDIVIWPSAAAAAGCSATATLLAESADPDYPSSWQKAWQFAATAAQGWRFDHWEMGYSYQEPAISGSSGNASYSSPWNPWSGALDRWGDTDPTEWYIDWYMALYPAEYREGWKYITSLKAVFVRDYTHLILRASEYSPLILHNASGLILRDD